jgi:hypothetical protein
MATRSSSKNTQISEATLQAILGKLQQQDKVIAGMAQLIEANGKPAAKTAAAKPTPPALSIEAYNGKHGAALLLKTNGSKWGVMLYPETWSLIKAHGAEIEAAFKKLPK